MSLDLCPELYWRLSPPLARATVKGARRRLAREYNERAWLAWHVAALVRIKRMPQLDVMLAKVSATPRRRQTWQEQMAIMGLWAVTMKRANGREG